MIWIDPSGTWLSYCLLWRAWCSVAVPIVHLLNGWKLISSEKRLDDWKRWGIKFYNKNMILDNAAWSVITSLCSAGPVIALSSLLLWLVIPLMLGGSDGEVCRPRAVYLYSINCYHAWFSSAQYKNYRRNRSLERRASDLQILTVLLHQFHCVVKVAQCPPSQPAVATRVPRRGGCGVTTAIWAKSWAKR